MFIEMSQNLRCEEVFKIIFLNKSFFGGGKVEKIFIILNLQNNNVKILAFKKTDCRTVNMHALIKAKVILVLT